MNINPLNWFRKASKTSQITFANPEGYGGTVWSDRDYENFAKETYMKNAIAYRAIDENAKCTASTPWGLFRKKKGGGRELIEDHELLRLIHRPNPEESFTFLILKVVAYLSMCGNAYFEKVGPSTGDNAGDARELYVKRPDRMEIEVVNGRKRYKYTVGGRSVYWEVDPITGQSDILQLKTFHPLDDYYGLAPTEPGAREIDTSNAATQWNKSMLDNQARPSLIYKIIGDVGETGFEDLEKRLEQRHSGPENAGKNIVIVGEEGTEVLPYGWTPKELDFEEGDLRLCRKIAEVYGVPPMLLGIPGEATFANYSEARMHYWETTIFYYLQHLRAEINNWLFFHDNPENLFFDYILDEVPALAPKREKIWRRAEESDFLTIDEKREMVGKEKLAKGGDALLVPANMIPIEMAIEGDSTQVDSDKKKPKDDEEKALRNKLKEEGFSDEKIDLMLGLDYEEE